MRNLLAFLLLLLTLPSFGQQEFFEHFSNVTASISETPFSGYETELTISGFNITDDTLHISVYDGALCLAYEGWLQDSSQVVAPGYFSVSWQGESICDWLEEVELVASECPFAEGIPLSCFISSVQLFPYEYDDNGTPIAQFPPITFTSTFTDSLTPEFTVAFPSNCGEGTVWDSTLHQCVPDITFPTAPCGQGTMWDPVNEECIIVVPTDNDFDGCVTPSDLLNLLATFGTCPPIPEWPVEPTDTTWACGDPVTYWDYDYATVLIDDQCWFAENLRTTVYANGDSIPASLTDGEWTSTTAGATTVFGEGSSYCGHDSPDIDACDEAQSLASYGRLYNWYAVDDARGLCPAGWHVPTDGEWTELEVYITSQGFAGTESTALKSTTGWLNNANGTDDFGFSALPGGYRDDFFGYFDYAGQYCGWWSSSPNGGSAWSRALYYDIPSVYVSSDFPRDGFSVRCLRDAE